MTRANKNDQYISAYTHTIARTQNAFRIMNYCDEHLRPESSKVLTFHHNLQAFRSFEYTIYTPHTHKHISIRANANKHALENQMDNLYMNRFDLFCNGRVRQTGRVGKRRTQTGWIAN